MSMVKRYFYVSLSAKTSLMLGVHKAGFRREAHIIMLIVKYAVEIYSLNLW